ncbi:hypothetical protein GH714_041789 [Hevea brasiliensis]|uniref:Glycosyltransferase 2-like domain-containing protein n=1 Tax=Hevea brasiliensis TaxID=3981 RepID=A0A6A6MVN6_HEVBR|nr:hypothetical protein GH714_041789 [Hevea brasiliensis]
MPRKGEDGRWVWIGLLGAELWFSLYWVITQAVRWKSVFRCTFKDRLSQRYKNELPEVDIFVCTANFKIEPPIMVVNTVLSVMAYDYLPEKLSVYLSDDGGSDLTFYALLEASKFAKHWIPYCKKFNVEPRSPAAYFASKSNLDHSHHNEVWVDIKILIDGKDPNAKDIDGCALPGLVYLAREKRPQHPHHFKAGAMNALIRVSSKISNGPIILNLDCDMYSNNSLSIQDALCFFMDKEKSHDIAFVQYPQHFGNLTKNDYIATHYELVSMRDALCGRKFTKDCKFEWKKDDDHKTPKSILELEEETKPLASYTYEENTQWGKEMGLRYGCPVEDVITGLSIQCRGWKSVYFNPERKAFIGIAPTTLPQTLVQQRRWAEGDFQILFCKYSPLWYAHGKISLGLQFGYCLYCLWAPISLPVLYYAIIPSFYLLKGVSLFPQVSSPWFLPFAYVISTQYIYNLAEFLWSGGTILGWWYEQRMWLYKRTSSYFFAFIDTILKMVGFTDSTFVVTAKFIDEDVLKRYEKEIMEFGYSSPMLTVLATLAMLNLFCFVGVVNKVIMNGSIFRLCKTMPLQTLLCSALVLINLPLYQGLFLRNDKGKLPSSLALKSFVVALLACTSFTLLC